MLGLADSADLLGDPGAFIRGVFRRLLHRHALVGVLAAFLAGVRLRDALRPRFGNRFLQISRPAAWVPSIPGRVPPPNARCPTPRPAFRISPTRELRPPRP